MLSHVDQRRPHNEGPKDSSLKCEIVDYLMVRFGLSAKKAC
jgi:hypothetical protein